MVVFVWVFVCVVCEGDVICLCGDVGVGKSVFVWVFMCVVMGDDGLDVSSSTYLV